MKIDGMKFILCVILIECQYVMQYSIAYITYCPCMGRLGNQIEQFLGMIAFAIRINRTLVLPPWNIMSSLKANFVPFENLFNITKLLLIHQFVSQENFMLNKAPLLWPTTKRTAICFRPRPGPLNNDCNAKDGNPFKEFWDTFNVSFTDSSFYFPLSADDPKEEWDRLFPPNIYPVLAFVGPPSSFPVRPENRIFHRYLEWNSHINVVTESFISRWLEKPIVGVHLRNGEDFVKHVVWKPNRKPEEDMALLGRIDLAILNCVSTYSASIKRERDVNNLPSMFFGLTNENQRDLEVLCNSTGDTKSLWWS
ncbi:GDP-fucose protein O-fucosyltransferase 1 isoform 2 [Schistosoma japonicum]|uniref:GDP-fucose protein O-fucosyltransferase 1 n=1 Tax=Schistosoma japonicum TaxID=6182 RepID=A0A4Z2DT72_SCHJA|nr:GDP-fucose protein O-fucosyltransferase 1 isoform 2 [Schistosoma japonicum]TNN19492.1 GDP-fucose protein O-fucosyltransferase 1 isoform 2 [Schistosoma japonicum]